MFRLTQFPQEVREPSPHPGSLLLVTVIVEVGGLAVTTAHTVARIADGMPFAAAASLPHAGFTA